MEFSSHYDKRVTLHLESARWHGQHIEVRGQRIPGMGSASHLLGHRDWLLDRQVAGAFVVLIASVIIMFMIRSAVVPLPTTLALFGFGQVQATYFPSISGAFFVALFLIYLYALAVLGAGLHRVLTVITGR